MTSTAETDKLQKRRTGRSPAYPYIPVNKAIEQARALHTKEGDYAVPLSSAVAAWGYSTKSSGGRQTLATLKYYGLIDVTGDGDARKVKVSDIARRIILDQREDDTEKRMLIRAVALSPSAHKTLYEQYPNGLASDASVEHFLIFERGFNADAAKELLAEFKITASQISLFQPAPRTDIPTESVANGSVKQLPKIKVGDKVQVTVAGVDMFADGATVLGFSEDGTYVFTDQADSGAKLEEVTLLEAAEAPPVERPPIPAHLLAARKREEAPKPGTRTAVFPISDGDVSLTFPEGISGAGLKSLKRYMEIFLDEQIEGALSTKPN
jgi:hypothetical protein